MYVNIIYFFVYKPNIRVIIYCNIYIYTYMYLYPYW